jgi:hypothetical protein
MVCLMEIRPERRADLTAPEQLITTPAVETHTYIDMFGNICRRFTAPPGDFSIWADGVPSPIRAPRIPSFRTRPKSRSPTCRTTVSPISSAAAIAKRTS